MHCEQIEGGPGTGKSTALADISLGFAETGLDPSEIGFSSFTREACRTASQKAASVLGVTADTLVDGGWFRTIHATCMRLLGIQTGQIISGDKKVSIAWLSNVFGCEVDMTETVDPDFGFPDRKDVACDVADVLAWWAYTRNTLGNPQETIYDFAGVFSMGFERAWGMVERYEYRKSLDSKFDFCDVLLLYGGRRVGRDGAYSVEPQGDLPPVRVWIFDEYQDSYAAIHVAARRLASKVDKIYVAGDRFQSIYQFSGGSPVYFLRGWKYTSRRILDQSYRCPRIVMGMGEQVINGCSDYVDRHIQPRAENGSLNDYTVLRDEQFAEIDPSKGSWLILGRTNRLAIRLGHWLNSIGIPWQSSKTQAYLSPNRRSAGHAMESLRSGQAVPPDQWRDILRNIPDDSGLVDKKLKTVLCADPKRITLPVGIKNAERFGATQRFALMLSSERWIEMAPWLSAYAGASDRYGRAEALDPSVRLGTIHSAKGDQADHVLLYDALTFRSAANFALGNRYSDEEHRTWYVGVTRARQSLTVFRFRNDRKAMFR